MYANYRLVALAGVFAVLGFITVLGVRASQQQQQTEVVPFTATVNESRFGSSGIKGYEEVVTFAFRSDGSNVRAVRRNANNGATFEIKEVNDTVTKTRLIVDQATESKTSYGLSIEDVSQMRSPKCDIPLNSDSITILGFLSYKIVEEKEYPGGFVSSRERWVAPALNCFPLRERISKPHAKGATAPWNVREATAVKLGEPDPGLFQVPSNYAERSPSVRNQEFINRFVGSGCPPDPDADKVYNEKRPGQAK